MTAIAIHSPVPYCYTTTPTRAHAYTFTYPCSNQITVQRFPKSTALITAQFQSQVQLHPCQYNRAIILCRPSRNPSFLIRTGDFANCCFPPCDVLADSALYATENSRLPQSYSVLQQNTQATSLHTNSSTSADASQANSTCHLAAAPFHMQGDALATNNANRLAFRSSGSATGVHSVEGLFGDGVPITYSASAVCIREATLNTNGLEPTVQSTLGLRDIPNAFSDAVRPVANQIGDAPQVSSAINQSFIPPVHPQTLVQSQTVHQAASVSYEKFS
ncbi:hypothetical protein F0562_024044 [Nyssa sinensis]|uniref:Uncharacterized protein n=1 Tax=Nyssa sinensis TaxID=561372 RepID=A0A5J5BMD7_9ASTE|nr:hypothetical protein F0562_024044 [Nyssa sinensis]